MQSDNAASGGTSASPNRQLKSSEVAATARAFARAYGREDTTALRSLLAPDVERVSPADTQHGRRSVLAQYRDQFRANTTVVVHELQGANAKERRDFWCRGRTTTKQGRH